MMAVDICDIQSYQIRDGVTTDQLKKLKSRKKSSPDQSTEERWMEMYQIIFPGELKPSSPCRANDLAQHFRFAARCVDLLTDVTDYEYPPALDDSYASGVSPPN